MDIVLKDLCSNATQSTIESSAQTHLGGSTPGYIGFIAAFSTVVLYSSAYVPVKKYKTGDGIFFQWIFCNGIFLSGLLLQMIHNSKFYALPMLGGAIWAIGNLCVVPIIQTIGIGLNIPLATPTALTFGWAIGRFGLYNTPKAAITHVEMNNFSVVLALISIIILLLVKNEVSSVTSSDIPPKEDSALLRQVGRVGHYMAQLVSRQGSAKVDPQSKRTSEGRINPALQDDEPQHDNGEEKEQNNVAGKNTWPTNLAVGNNRPNHHYGDEERAIIVAVEEKGPRNIAVEDDEKSIFDDLPAIKKKIIGSVLAIFSGIMYAHKFAPTLYVQENYKDASQDGLDYAFAQYCGIYLASTVVFVIYCVYKRNKIKVIIPGLISGSMWAIATGCWNVANSALSQAISYPIIQSGPGVLSALIWGVGIYKEIRGRKNIAILIAGFSTNLIGALLAGLSK